MIVITKKYYTLVDVFPTHFSLDFKSLKSCREKIGLKTQKTCFHCHHKFGDNEKLYIGVFNNHAGNKFLCKECWRKAMKELGKEPIDNN